MDKPTHDEFVRATMEKLGEALDTVNGQACVVVVACTPHGWSLLEGRGDHVREGGTMVRKVGGLVAMLHQWLEDMTQAAGRKIH